ncbi:MAG: biotin--[acetyl-CoA-carboxylase] ligase [Nitrospirae bacterium]|nr:biotin--[acetyl-CoA-carboxylase] ligase [Nitrospirota bacterium]
MKQTYQIDNLIISILKNNSDSFVSGQHISSKIKLTRSAVWKHIESLRKKGYVIESIPSRGYRLIEIPDRLSPDDIRTRVGKRIIGKEILFFDEVDSTNNVAMEKAGSGAAEGLVVLSEGQSHGKGRMGRTWVSPKYVNIYLSILFRPDLSPQYSPVMTMMSAVSTARAITEVTGLRTQIKWPNDILIDRKKVSGILMEMNAEQERINHIVAGIGINVNMKERDFPDGLRMPATSLAECLGKKVDRTDLLLMLIEILEEDYEELRNGGVMSIFSRWRKGCDILDRRIRVSLPGEEITGVAEDLTPEGGLVLNLDGSGKRIIYAGDVSIIR